MFSSISIELEGPFLTPYCPFCGVLGSCTYHLECARNEHILKKALKKLIKRITKQNKKIIKESKKKKRKKIFFLNIQMKRNSDIKKIPPDFGSNVVCTIYATHS